MALGQVEAVTGGGVYGSEVPAFAMDEFDIESIMVTAGF